MKPVHKRTKSQRMPTIRLPDLKLELLIKPKSLEDPGADIQTTLRNRVKVRQT